MLKWSYSLLQVIVQKPNNNEMKKFYALLLFLVPLSLTAQRITPEDYIETYKDIAMREMREHKIPASITLAQGIL